MFWVIFGILIGIIVGLSTKFSIPVEYARYTAVGIMAILDSIFGALRADLVDVTGLEVNEREKSLKDRYKPTIFISGLVFGMVLAMAITYLGDRLGIDLYIAVLVVFTWRIFNNLGIIRRALLKRWEDRKKSKVQGQKLKVDD